jgi:hypothetical protein
MARLGLKPHELKPTLLPNGRQVCKLGALSVIDCVAAGRPVSILISGIGTAGFDASGREGGGETAWGLCWDRWLCTSELWWKYMAAPEIGGVPENCLSEAKQRLLEARGRVYSRTWALSETGDRTVRGMRWRRGLSGWMACGSVEELVGAC